MESNNVQIIPAKRKKLKVEENINKPMKKLKVAAYCRVSKNSENLKKSLDTQINYFKKKIRKNQSWEFVGIYFDEGISGTRISRRTEFQKMINKGLRHEIDLILTKSVTRFARNTVDLLDTVRKLKDVGCEVRFEKENISTLSKDGELLLTILAAFAQAEAESISANVKWGKQKASEKGKDQYRPLYGYDYKNGKYIVNKFEGDVVVEIFKRFLNGDTYKQISDTLKKRGIKTRKGNLFNYPQVKCILKNEKYAGFTVLQKHYTLNPITHKVKSNFGELPKYKLNNTHPALVTESNFYQVQNKIKSLSIKFCHQGQKTNDAC